MLRHCFETHCDLLLETNLLDVSVEKRENQKKDEYILPSPRGNPEFMSRLYFQFGPA